MDSAKEKTLNALRQTIASMEGRGVSPQRNAPQGKTSGLLASSDNSGNSSSDADPALGTDAALRRIMHMLSVREQSSVRLLAKLRDKGFAEDIANDAMVRAMDYGIVDDLRYADSLIRERLSAGKGLRKALEEIEQLGIDPVALPSYQEHVAQGEDHELDRALGYLAKRPPRSKNLREGAYRKLVSQGFDVPIASRAARLWAEEQQP